MFGRLCSHQPEPAGLFMARDAAEAQTCVTDYLYNKIERRAKFYSYCLVCYVCLHLACAIDSLLSQLLCLLVCDQRIERREQTVELALQPTHHMLRLFEIC